MSRCTKILVKSFLCVLHLGSLEHCFGVQCLSLAWVVFVSLDPTDVLAPSEAPLPQTLKYSSIQKSFNPPSGQN